MKRFISASLAVCLTVWAGAVCAQQQAAVPAAKKAGLFTQQQPIVASRVAVDPLDVQNITAAQRRRLVAVAVSQIIADQYDKMPEYKQKQMASAIVQQVKQNPALKGEVLEQLKPKKIETVPQQQPQKAPAQH